MGLASQLLAEAATNLWKNKFRRRNKRKNNDLNLIPASKGDGIRYMIQKKDSSKFDLLHTDEGLNIIMQYAIISYIYKKQANFQLERKAYIF